MYAVECIEWKSRLPCGKWLWTDGLATTAQYQWTASQAVAAAAYRVPWCEEQAAKEGHGLPACDFCCSQTRGKEEEKRYIPSGGVAVAGGNNRYPVAQEVPGLTDWHKKDVHAGTAVFSIYRQILDPEENTACQSKKRGGTQREAGAKRDAPQDKYLFALGPAESIPVPLVVLGAEPTGKLPASLYGCALVALTKCPCPPPPQENGPQGTVAVAQRYCRLHRGLATLTSDTAPLPLLDVLIGSRM